jgi:hypothetical protein
LGICKKRKCYLKRKTTIMLTQDRQDQIFF